MIHILDRFSADRFLPRNATIAIRCLSSLVVRTQRNIEYENLDRKLYVGILSLVFDDITPEDKLNNPSVDYVLFDYNQAKEISDFLDFNKGKFKDVMVHCDFGQSRSCAVGAAIVDCFEWEYDQGIWYRSERGPNMHVYSVLMNRLTTKIH